MAKRKSEETDVVSEDHFRLRVILETARLDRESMLLILRDPRMNRVLSRFDREIETSKEALCSAEKAEVVALQASIAARRLLLQDLRQSYETEVAEAQTALKEFEEKNALLIAGAKAARQVVEKAQA